MGVALRLISSRGLHLGGRDFSGVLQIELLLLLRVAAPLTLHGVFRAQLSQRSQIFLRARLREDEVVLHDLLHDVIYQDELALLESALEGLFARAQELELVALDLRRVL